MENAKGTCLFTSPTQGDGVLVPLSGRDQERQLPERPHGDAVRQGPHGGAGGRRPGKW